MPTILNSEIYRVWAHSTLSVLPGGTVYLPHNSMYMKTINEDGRDGLSVTNTCCCHRGQLIAAFNSEGDIVTMGLFLPVTQFLNNDLEAYYFMN